MTLPYRLGQFKDIKGKTYLVDRLPDPKEECFHIECATFLKWLIQRWEHHSRVHICVCVEDERKDRKSCVDGRIAEHQEAIVNRDRHEVEKDNEDGLNHLNYEASVEHELW